MQIMHYYFLTRGKPLVVHKLPDDLYTICLVVHPTTSRLPSIKPSVSRTELNRYYYHCSVLFSEYSVV